jgi:hypothetical protein
MVDTSTGLVYPTLIMTEFSGGRGVHFEPILLTTFFRTVGIILFASAPSALDLREMTKEYWDLLLSLRSASTDPSVMEAILFGMLIILEITDPRYAAENFPKHVVETQSWTAGSFSFNYPPDRRSISKNGRGQTKSVGRRGIAEDKGNCDKT